MSSSQDRWRDNTTFVMLSFEGPDAYSFAGGLAVRVTHLTQTLASMGFPTHHFFIGDPYREGLEETQEGRITLHRWCQWISKYYPEGVYQAEHEKLWDFNRSAPPFIVDEIVKPAVARNRSVVIMAEEWQTTQAVCNIVDQIRSQGLDEKVTVLWNANNTYGFDQIDWPRLGQAATLTTVSRYMKWIMRQMDLNPLVVPNGIPRRLLKEVNERQVSDLRRALGDRIVLCKVARWTPEKCWIEAIEAVSELRSKGKKVTLLARGSTGQYETEVLDAAQSAGLTVKDVHCDDHAHFAKLNAMEDIEDVDVANLKFFLPEEVSRVIFLGSDGVLANSEYEPFGLVGLETMAAGGVAFTGSTGEDYAVPYENAIVLDTTDPLEIAEHVSYLDEHAEVEERIRLAARQTASRYTWEEVVEGLLRRIEYLREEPLTDR